MSEPAAIITKIHLAETDYRQLLKKAKATFANCIFISLQEHSDYRDFYLFGYHKKQFAFYALAWFNYGSDVNLELTAEWNVFQHILSVLPASATGYCIGTYWATSPDDAESIDFSYRINNGKALKLNLESNELKVVGEDADIFLFKKAVNFSDFKSDLFAGRMVDREIVAEVKYLQQQFMLTFLKNNLHTATFSNPVPLGENYFYNGSYLYTFYNYTEPKIFGDIDIHSLKKTDYGFCDKNYAVLPQGKIPLNGCELKILKKGNEESLYYLTNQAVYNGLLELLPEADPATFKLLNPYLASDKDFLYLNGQPFSKNEVGAYRFDRSGYYYNDVMLIGEKGIWMGSNEKLTSVNAATFEILEYDNSGLPSAGLGSGYLFLRKCSDKHGVFFIYRTNLYEQVKIERALDFDDFLQQQKQHFSTKKDVSQVERHLKTPNYDHNGTAETFYNQFNPWLSENTSQKLERYKSDPWFYDILNRYFNSCWEMYLNFKDVQYLQDARIIYEMVQQWCWLIPKTFHTIARVYLILNLEKQAMEAVISAFQHHYTSITDLLQDIYLAPLENEIRTSQLEAYYNSMSDQWSMITSETLQCFEESIPEAEKYKIAQYLIEKYIFWDKNWIVGYAEHYPERREYFEIWQKMNDSFIGKYLFVAPTGNIYIGINLNNYYRYMNFELLNPLIHLDFIEAKFHDAHTAKNEDYINGAYSAINTAFEKLQNSLTSWENKKNIVQQVTNSDMWQLLLKK